MKRGRPTALDLQRRTQWRKEQAIRDLMERRFATADRKLLTLTILWRMRRYCDAGDTTSSDALAELLPQNVVVQFYDWYFDLD